MARKQFKQLSCRDAGWNCHFLVRADTEEEVMKVATDHGCRVHHLCEITPDLKARIQSSIRTVSI